MEQDKFLNNWVRSRKNDFARRIIRDSGAEKRDYPAAIFMAGLPGAGKTEFTKSWISNSRLKVVRLDMDEIAAQIETYSPSEADKFRKAASTLLNYTYDLTIKGKYDFVMDGTFRSKYALQNIERAIKRGYVIKVIYIYQDPKIAWAYTLAREKVEHRAINKPGFIDSYFETLNNLRELENRHFPQVSIDLIVKNPQNEIAQKIKNITVKDIDKYVNINYDKDNLQRILK